MSSRQSSATIRRRTKTTRVRTGLLSHAFNNTSQNGEDGILRRIFELLPHPAAPRTCVDVGAWDGKHLSNTFTLLTGSGIDHGSCPHTGKWRGILIEADTAKFEQLQSLYAQTDNICVNVTVSCHAGSPCSLRLVLDEYTAAATRDGGGIHSSAWDLQRDFDFLCIDVDGIDYWLLHDILGGDDCDYVNRGTGSGDDERKHQRRYYRPKVICIEFNPTMPSDLIYIQPRSDSIRHGSSLSALVELADSFDYVLVETTVFNAFFVHRDLYEAYLRKEVPDTSIEALHEITMGTQMYQLYDGTIKLWGCKRMLWHRLPIDEAKMQMLTADEREFPFAPGDNGESTGRSSLDLEIVEAAIDMSPYCKQTPDCDSDSKKACHTKLNATLQKDGFALVKGTNISSAVCINALKYAKSFLHEADESVRRFCLTKDRARRGYSPMCTENFASLIGEKRPNDLVKKFRVGPDQVERHENEQRSLSSLHQPNAWPNEEVWDQSVQFRSAIDEYFEQLRIAADCVLRAICDGIIAEDANLEESMSVITESLCASSHKATDSCPVRAHHTSILTLLGYQPGSRHKKGSKGYLNPLVAAHTDVGMITVLLFDGGSCASLQRAVTACEGEADDLTWSDVNLPSRSYLKECDDPIFVVNVGDCLSELTEGHLRSTLHRVIPCPSKSKSSNHDDAVRTSLGLFVGLDQSAQLVLPNKDIITYEEWRKRRIGKALDIMKS